MSASKTTKPTPKNRRADRLEVDCRDNQRLTFGGRVYVVVGFLPEEYIRLRILADEALTTESAMLRRLTSEAHRERMTYLETTQPGANAAPRTEDGSEDGE
jgi:hypothetical protein